MNLDDLNNVLLSVSRGLSASLNGEYGHEPELVDFLRNIGVSDYASDYMEKLVAVMTMADAPDVRNPPFDQGQVPMYLGIYPER